MIPAFVQERKKLAMLAADHEVPKWVLMIFTEHKQCSDKASLIKFGRQRQSYSQFSSVQSLPILCDPMDCSTPDFFVLQYLPEFAQTHVHWISDAIQPFVWSSVNPFSSCLQSFPAPRSFPMSRLFTSGGQSIWASAVVLPVYIRVDFL